MTLPAWLIALPVVVAGSAALSTSTPAWIAALAGVVGFEAGAVILLGAWLTFLAPEQRRLRPAHAVVLFAVAGALSGLVSGGVLHLAGADVGETIVGRVLVTMVVSAAWLAGGALIVDAVRRDRLARAELLTQLARERALGLQSARVVEEFRRRTIEETERVVAEQLGKALEVSAEPGVASARLTQVVEDVVRPLSRELTQSMVDESGLIETLQVVGRSATVPVRRSIADAFSLRNVVPPCAVLLGGTSLIAAGGQLLTSILLVGYALAVAAFLGSVERRASAVDEDLAEAMRASEWAAARLRQLAWSEQQVLGRILHGEIQAQIVSLALRIQLDENTDVARGLETLAGDVRSHLSARSEPLEWHAMLERVRAVWDFSISLSFDIDPDVEHLLDGDPLAARSFTEVVREGVTNAVRHAHATGVSVSVHRAGDCIEVKIDDNGRVSSDVGVPGLGSRTLDAACLVWQLLLTDSGHCLTASVPVAGGHAST